MAVVSSTAIASEIKPLYDADFYMAGQSRLYWDQLTDLRKVMNGQRGISYNFPIVESNIPTPAPLSEVTDVTPQSMTVNEVVVTLQEYGGAIEVTRFAAATSYADVYQQAAYVNGYQMAETLDLVVRAVAGQGSRQFFINNRTSRSQIAGVETSADRMNAAFLEQLAHIARSIRMPLFDDGSIVAVMHPFVFYDLLQSADVRTMASRQSPEILFNGELGYWGGVRIITTTNAKAFWGEGAARTSNFSAVLTAAASPGDTTITVDNTANLSVGMWIAIRDASEPGNTWSDTNELFRVTGISGNNVSGFVLDPGPGDEGGLRYAHPTGTVVRSNQSVYATVLLGPNSITKAASSLTGPYGETIVSGPFDRLGRFLVFGWYAILGYARTRNGWLMRGETGSSMA